MTILTLDKSLIAKLDTATFAFQKNIIERLKLYDFATAAITAYCQNKSAQFEGHDFNAFKSKFKLLQFKKDAEIKSIDGYDMIQVGHSFVGNELADSIFVLNMANFEQWILNVLRTAFIKDPGIIYEFDKGQSDKKQNEKQIDISLIKEALDLNDLWNKIIDKYLMGLPYDGIKKMLNRLLKVFDIKKTDMTTDIIERINEKSQCRHLIVHNHKKVNDAYITKSGKFAKFKKNETVIIDEKLLFEEGDDLLRFMQDFRKNMTRKLKK